jgi:hypothetical protein
MGSPLYRRNAPVVYLLFAPTERDVWLVLWEFLVVGYTGIVEGIAELHPHGVQSIRVYTTDDRNLPALAEVLPLGAKHEMRLVLTVNGCV